MAIARVLFDYVAEREPDVHERILEVIRPHSLEAVLELFQRHLESSVSDLNVFNLHRQRIPEFCLQFVLAIRKRFPTPGDAFGIQLTCRVTKSNTQGTLDSKHLTSLSGRDQMFHVEKSLWYELTRFANQTQVFEMASRHAYATVWTRDYTVSDLLQRLPDAGWLQRGAESNKATNVLGHSLYVSTFTYIVVEPDCVLYKSAKDWCGLLRRLDLRRVVAFSDIRAIYQKCGIVSYFFNLLRVVERQLFRGDLRGSEAKDVVTIVKYQCRTGRPLPATRNGLEKNPVRSLLEILSFEAWKKNLARMCTLEKQDQDVRCSMDRMFFGEQPMEGTGGEFSLLPQK
ncbi:hypothetical protein AVEN_261773-1 [Araneus ventricosus]|uniref:Uncharacterized protein n=1 Tax=Araneus ventricosus TaxID=182803 RepID=A0A4Y2M1T4_ARAVE|nr:hypothetical protein AVEN_261773-1 [Araneus ventricosus]